MLWREVTETERVAMEINIEGKSWRGKSKR